MKTCDSSRPGSLLETTLNTRDLGGYQSGITGKPLKPWHVLRSDVPARPSDRDIALLKQRKILTFLDMRSGREVAKKPHGFSGKDGFGYLHIPIEEGGGIPESTDAVSESYLKIAESNNAARIFRAIAAASDGVMINCTAGKDRTGVISAVLLGVCGVPEDAIVRDYMLTKENNQERFEAVRKNFPDIDMEIVIPHERYMTDFLSRLKSKYGGFSEYLLGIGITKEEMGRIRASLL